MLTRLFGAVMMSLLEHDELREKIMRKLSEDFIGTCQCCFGEFKVENGTMVLHGFKRPGGGFVVGQCPGTGHKPFEHDHSLTDAMIVQLFDDASREWDMVADLKTGVVVELPRSWTEYDRVTFKSVKKSEMIGPDSEHWEHVCGIEIANRENAARWNEQTAAYFAKMVAEWKWTPVIGLDVPATGKVREVRDAYDPEVAAEQARKAAEKAERAAKPGKLKLMLFYVESHGNKPVDETAWRKWIDAKDAKKAKTVAAAKKWANETFPGKVRVTDAYDTDIPYKLRKQFNQSDFLETVTINLDWSYLATVEEMFPESFKVTENAKKVSFTVNISDKTPWA